MTPVFCLDKVGSYGRIVKVTSETPIGPNGEYLFTFDGMKKVVSGSGTGTLAELAPFVVTVWQIFVENFLP